MATRNENRTGYKPTKVGWIPDEWDCVPLAALSTLITNGFVGMATSAYSEAKDAVLYVQGYNVNINEIDFTGIKSVNRLFHLRNKRSALRLNDILTIQTGEIGTSALVPETLNDANCHALIITRTDQCLASSKFYVQYFNSTYGRSSIRKISTGSILKHINCGDFKILFVPVPPLPEQQKIAAILSAWDLAIEQTGKLIEAKKWLKKSLMQQLLTGRMRFREFGVPSENKSKLPIGWQKSKLQEIARIRRGASPRPISDPKWFAESGRGWIRISDVTDSAGSLNQTSQYLSADGEKASVNIDPGDLILSICATIGVPVLVDIPACIHDGFVVIRAYETRLNKHFLFHCLSLLTVYLAGKGQPGTQKNLNTGIVGNIQIAFPSISEQNRIVAVLSASDREIAALKKKSSSLQQQKQALMQKLLTGELRVKV